MRARSFSPTSEFTGSSIVVKRKPVKKYKRAPEKRTSKPVKSPYGVGRYCDMAVSPTRSHLLCMLPYPMIGIGLEDLHTIDGVPAALSEKRPNFATK